ncbi:MAG: hypothetical protein ACOVQR_12505 [Flavobacterium sp.]|jgi:hypothetical protein|uniref:hypothetical protein n=1 Tax=Flavobacterium sp. TaxID=239 RepID=UPI003BA4513D
MKEKSIEIKILQIKTLRFSYTHKDNLEDSKFDENKINFIYKSTIGLKVNTENETVDVKFLLKVFIPKKREDILTIEVLCSYHFKNLKDFEISENEVDLPEDIIENLVITSISNTRGVLAVKVIESGFTRIILPLIQMDELIPKDNVKKQKKGT